MSPNNKELHEAATSALFGPFRLDLETQRLYEGDQLTSLPTRAADVLALLVRSQGRLVTREKIREAIWGERHLDFDASLNTAVRSIRRALNDNATNPKFVETAPRRGYRFLHPVTFETTEKQKQKPKIGLFFDRIPILVGALTIVTVCAIILILRSHYETTVTSNTEAFRAAISSKGYDDFMRGRYALSRGRTKEAELLLDSAVRADPALAPAHVSLAKVHIRNRKDGWHKILLADEHLSRAIKASPNLVDAHAMKGAVALYYFRDRRTARKHLDRAFAINPKNVDARVYEAYWFVINGDNSKALESIAAAHAQNPLSAQINSDYGWILYKAGNLTEAEKLCKTSVELNPESEFALSCVIHINHSQRDSSEAAEYGLRLMALRDANQDELTSIRNIKNPNLRETAFWSWTLDWLESNAEAKVIDPMSKKAIALTMLGKYDEAVQTLHQAYKQNGEPFLAFLAVDPRVYDLRTHERFSELAKRSRGAVPL